jgi:hypothetical protein
MSSPTSKRDQIKQRVVLAAIKWGAYQEEDSISDQLQDNRVLLEAAFARQDLLDAIEEYNLCL